MFFTLQNFYTGNNGKRPNKKINVKIFFDDVTLCINNFEICVNLNVCCTKTELEELFKYIIKVEDGETYKDYIKDSGTYRWHLPSDITEDIESYIKKECQNLSNLIATTGNKNIKTTGSIINKESLEKKRLPVSLLDGNFVLQSIGIAIDQQYDLCLIETLSQPNLEEPKSKKSKIYLGSADNKLTYYILSPENKILKQVELNIDVKDLNEQFLQDEKIKILDALLQKRLINQGNIMFYYGEEGKYGGKLWGYDGRNYYNSIAFDVHIRICTAEEKEKELSNKRASLELGFFEQIVRQIYSRDSLLEQLAEIINDLELIELFKQDIGIGVKTEQYRGFYEKLVDLIIDRKFTHKRSPIDAEIAYNKFFERLDYRRDEIEEVDEREKIEIEEIKEMGNYQDQATKTEKTMYTPNYESYFSSSVSYFSLRMLPSNNLRFPNDVIIQGLPMNITESQIRQRFETYGTILKINLPDQKNYSCKIAYITFIDREIALQNFNNSNKATSKIRNTF